MPISQVDCLKLLYRSFEQGGDLRVGDIARHLEIQQPSATQMVRLMSRKGWVTWSPRAAPRITRLGVTEAVRVIRRHRILETYLVDKVGLSLSQAHFEAENLEHAASEELIDRLHELCGRPRFDPHGDPIPTREGVFPRLPRSCTLSELASGQKARVVALSDQEIESLREIEDTGLRCGDEIERISARSFRKGDKTFVLSEAALGRVRVSVISANRRKRS